MKDNVIIGISAYAGSNLSWIFEKIEFLLTIEGHKPAFYSLEKCSIGCIVSRIFSDKNHTVHIIEGITSIQEIEKIKEDIGKLIEEGKREDVTYLTHGYGIQIDWEECFAFLKKNELIDPSISRAEWREANMKDPYRNKVLECHAAINARSGNVFRFQDSSEAEPAAAIVDKIRLELKVRD